MLAIATALLGGNAGSAGFVSQLCDATCRTRPWLQDDERAMSAEERGVKRSRQRRLTDPLGHRHARTGYSTRMHRGMGIGN